MPVDLSLVPKALSKPSKFKLTPWVIGLIVVLALGALITFTWSFFESLSDWQLILGALFYPFILWLVVLLAALYFHFYCEGYAEEWNKQREERIVELTEYAQRGLYVLHYSILTEYGESGNAKGISENKYTITTKKPYSGGDAVAHSALSLPDGIMSTNIVARLEIIFATLQKKLLLAMKQLPVDSRYHVRLVIDADINDESIITLWQSIFANTIDAVSLSIIPVVQSHQFIETWLDNSDHDDEKLLIISAHLFGSPNKGSAESAQLFLCVGENVIHSLPKNTNLSVAIKVYRGEYAKDLITNIDTVLRWGDEHDKAYDGVWYSGVSVEQNIAIMNYLNAAQRQQGEIFNIDTSIGYARYDAYFLALALAIEQTRETQNKQLIVVGKPHRITSVVASTMR